MTSVVIGARGFLGTALCRELLRRGEKVRGTVRRGHSDLEGGHIPLHRIDLARTPMRVLRRFVEEADTIYHLAWSSIPQTATANPIDDLQDNVVGMVRLLEAVRISSRARIIFASSGGTVYGRARQLPIDEDHPTNPLSAYGVSKLSAESYLGYYAAEHGVSSASLRIGNAYGIGQNLNRGLGAVTAFTHAAVEGRPITIYGDGSVLRDYVWVDDVVSALLAAGDHRRVTGAVNIGSGVGTTLLTIVDEIEKVMGYRPEVIWKEGRRFDVSASQLDITRAMQELGWRPRVDVRSGIGRLCRYFQDAMPRLAAQ